MIFGSRAERVGRLSGISPEEVLLQITLGFMIVLGYLLSNEIEMQAPLRKKLQEVERSNVALEARLADVDRERLALKAKHGFLKKDVQLRLKDVEKLLKEVMRTPQGQLAMEKLQALVQVQKAVLSNSWTRVKGEHKLFESVHVLESGLLTDLPADRLRQNKQFRNLSEEVSRAYLAGPGGSDSPAALEAEAKRLSRLCAEAKGLKVPTQYEGYYDLASAIGDKQLAEAFAFGDDYLRIESRTVTAGNYYALKKEIRADLVSEKGKVAGLQFRAVRKIAEAMAEGYVAEGKSVDVRQIWLSVIKQMKKELNLLSGVFRELESVR